MKKLMGEIIFTVLGLMAMQSTGQSAPAAPVNECRPAGFSENSAMEIKYLQAAVGLIQCGQLDGALQRVNVAQKLIVKELTPQVSITARGSCFTEKGCKGSNLGTAAVEKGTCEAAGGKSWKQSTPTEADCVNI
jgi:hypothetical protein